jgi:hypothetical protein
MVEDEPARTVFERSGGFAGITQRSTLDAADLDPEERARYLELLRGLDLGSLSTTPSTAEAGPALPSASRGADRFQYDLSVELGGQSYQLRYGEQDLPTEVKPLIELLTQQARKQQ